MTNDEAIILYYKSLLRAAAKLLSDLDWEAENEHSECQELINEIEEALK